MMNARSLLKTYQNLIISGVILLFCCVGVLFGVVPAVSKVQSLVGDVQQASDENAALQKKLTVLNSLDETALRSQLSEVISAIPNDKSLPTVFSTLDGLAAQSGVSVSSVNISGDTALASSSAVTLTPEERQLGTRTIPFSVMIEGSLDAIQKFITLAPRVRRLLRTRTFAISFPPDNRQIRIELEMDAFYEPLPSAIGAPSAAITPLSPVQQAVVTTLSQLPLANSAQISLPPPAVGAPRSNPFSL